MNVTDFPKLPDEEFLVGPFTSYRVVIHGKQIPKLRGHPIGDNDVELVLDGRFSIITDKETSKSVAWMIANAMAIGAGYSSMSADSKDAPFAPNIGVI